jgi:hypothetical protein
MAPAMTYMSHDLRGEGVLERTSLASIGVAGGTSVLLRVHFVPFSEVPCAEQESVEGAEKGKEEVEEEENEREKGGGRTSLPGTGETAINPVFLKEIKKKGDEAMDTESVVAPRKSSAGTRGREKEASSDVSVEKMTGKDEHEDEHIGPLDRRTKVYLPSETRVEWGIPDDVYDLTPEDIRLLHEQAVKRRKNEEKLMTREMRQRKKMQKKRKYCKGYVRVRMPSGYVLEGQFRPKETMEEVRNFVLNALSVPSDEFTLHIPPLKITDGDLKKTLESMDVLPACMLHLSFIQPDSKCDLSAELMASVLPFEKAEVAPRDALVEKPSAAREKQEEVEGASHSHVTPSAQTHSEPPPPPRPEHLTSPGPASKNVPKWFQKGH